MTAKKIFLKTITNIKNSNKKIDLVFFFKTLLTFAQPKVNFRNKKISGTLHRVPVPYKHTNQFGLATRWLVKSSKNSRGVTFDKKFSQELSDAFLGKGEAVKKKKDTHRLAIVNKVNLKYM